jgi:hypothetical protein
VRRDSQSSRPFCAIASLSLAQKSAPLCLHLAWALGGNEMIDERPIPGKEFFAALGFALFQAQALEDVLVSLFASSNLSPAKSGEMIRALMDTRYKQTLGRLVRDASEELELSADLEEKLAAAVEKRNWVAHRFFREFGMASLSEEAQGRAVGKLTEVTKLLDALCTEIFHLARQRLVNTGQQEAEIRDSLEGKAADFVTLHEDLSRIDAWSERLSDESAKYTQDILHTRPDADATIVRESFLLQKIAGLFVLVENLYKQRGDSGGEQ